MPKRWPASFWVVAAILLAGAGLFAFVGMCIAKSGGHPKAVGWTTRIVNDEYVVSSVTDPVANGLRAGDVVVALNGHREVRVCGPELELARVRVGATYVVDVERDRRPLHFALAMAEDPSITPRQILSAFLLALLLYGTSVYIGLLRPEDGTARLAAASFFVGALVTLTPVVRLFSGWSHGTALAAILATKLWKEFELPVSYHFTSRFPASAPNTPLRRTLRYVFYGAAAIVWTTQNLPVFAQTLGLPSLAVIRVLNKIRPGSPLGTIGLQAFQVSAGAAICLVLIFNYITSRDSDARKRLRWAGLGIAGVMVPYVLVSVMRLLQNLFGGGAPEWPLIERINGVGFLTTGACTLMFAYAVVKHRVFGIQVVIRRGVQYLLARNVLRLIVSAPLLAIAAVIVTHPERPVQALLLQGSWPFYGFVAVTAAISLRYRTELRLWVDGKFFRTAFEREVVLMALIDRMQTSESLDEVSRVVARELDLAFHPTQLFILYRRQATAQFTVSFPADSPAALEIRSVLNERLEEAREAPDPASASLTASNLAAALKNERASSVTGLKKMLATPIATGEGELVGVLLLGEKRSEEPYSDRDQKLLQAIGIHLAMAYEVLSLKERVREEGKVRVEVLGRLDEQQIQLVKECEACGACYHGATTHCERDRTELRLTLPVERHIEGKYRLDRRIGTGGMGAVFEAWDLRLDRQVAVKILTGRLFGNQAALRRFEREARTAAKLNHPNIVGIHDFGTLGGGGAYLVMPLIPGRSWRAELDRSTSMQPARLADWCEQLFAAVGEAHAHGVIHRDLKPENVLITDEAEGAEKITVLDFGLAKMRSESWADNALLTTDGMIVGTLGYMSPEQRAGGEVDARADIFTAGVMVVESLSGVRPPTGGATVEWMYATLRWTAPNFATKQLTTLLESCLAAEASARVDRMKAVEQYVVPLLRDCPAAIWLKGSATDGETMVAGI